MFDEIYNKLPDSLSLTMKNLYNSIHALSTEQLFLLLEDRHSWHGSKPFDSYGFIDSDLWRDEICHFARWELLSRFMLSYPPEKEIILKEDMTMSAYVFKNTLKADDIEKDRLVNSVSEKYLVKLNSISDLYQNYKVIYSVYQIYENDFIPHSITSPSKYGLEMIKIFPSLLNHVKNVYISIGRYIDKHSEFTSSLDSKNDKWFEEIIIPKIRKELERIYIACYFGDYGLTEREKEIIEKMSDDELFDIIFIQGKCNKLIAERKHYAKTTIKYDIPYDYNCFYHQYYPDIDKLLCSENEWFTRKVTKEYQNRIEEYQNELKEITDITYSLFDDILELIKKCNSDIDDVKEKLHGESNYKDISRFHYAKEYIESHKWRLSLLEYPYYLHTGSDNISEIKEDAIYSTDFNADLEYNDNDDEVNIESAQTDTSHDIDFKTDNERKRVSLFKFLG